MGRRQQIQRQENGKHDHVFAHTPHPGRDAAFFLRLFSLVFLIGQLSVFKKGCQLFEIGPLQFLFKPLIADERARFCIGIRQFYSRIKILFQRCTQRCGGNRKASADIVQVRRTGLDDAFERLGQVADVQRLEYLTLACGQGGLGFYLPDQAAEKVPAVVCALLGINL